MQHTQSPTTAGTSTHSGPSTKRAAGKTAAATETASAATSGYDDHRWQLGDRIRMVKIVVTVSAMEYLCAYTFSSHGRFSHHLVGDKTSRTRMAQLTFDILRRTVDIGFHYGVVAYRA